ncbi:polysaccharide biosynthesis tyrosine autokinase [Thomasclavelia spiroformis]|uniref:polysaccharide biosynthesis tyrosine autokinase n=1 Tax=Thomasclavelia spiroformis TaxID=29348 RepID=UPI00399059C4
MEDEITIDLDILSVIRVIIKKIWIVLYVGVICAIGLDTFYIVTYQPEYQTSSQFLVTVKENATYNTWTTIISTQEMAEKFSYLLSSSVMAKEVADNLNFDTLPGVIETSVLDESSIVTVNVKADSPINAYNIMNNLISSYSDVSMHMDEDAILEPLDEIRLPVTPSNHLNSRRNLLIGFAVGAVVSMGLIILYELLKDDIKTEKHVEKKLDISLFGTLYEEKRGYLKFRKKRNILINDITTSFEYVENIKTIRSKLEHYLTTNKMKSVLITSTLENEGKSTLAVNLALSFSKTGAKVLLVDMDLKKPSLHKILTLDQSKIMSLEQTLENKKYQQAVFKNIWGIDVIVNDKTFIDSELLLENIDLNDLFNELKKHYDYIIVDSAPVLAGEDTAILSSKIDATLFVTRQNYGKVRYINDAIDLIKDTGGNLIGCILTRCFKLPFTKMVNYGHYHNYYGNHYRKLFKESQEEIKKSQGDLNG